MFEYLRDCFLESTGIDLNEMYLVTKIKAECFTNPWSARGVTIYPYELIKENWMEIEDDLYKIAYSIHYEEIDNYKIINYSNYTMLTVTYESDDTVSNCMIQEIYEFVKK